MPPCSVARVQEFPCFHGTLRCSLSTHKGFDPGNKENGRSHPSYDRRNEAHRHSTNTPPHRDLPTSTPQASVLDSLDTGNGAAVHSGECSTPGSGILSVGKEAAVERTDILLPRCVSPENEKRGYNPTHCREKWNRCVPRTAAQYPRPPPLMYP